MKPIFTIPPSLLRSAAVILGAGAVLASLTGCVSTDGAGVTQPSAKLPPASVANAGSLDRDLFNRVNAQRISQGLPALAWNSEMTRLAGAHTRSMAAQNKLSHDGYGSRSGALKRGGLVSVTENVAYNKGKPDPVGAAIAGWMASPGHRKNLSDRGDTLTGVAAAKNSQGYYFFTQIYGQ